VQSIAELFTVSVNSILQTIRTILGRPVKKDTGAAGEAIAVKFLARNGYRIVASNWRCRIGEIDIIAYQGRTCVFVEVKSSAKLHSIYPEDRVRSRKQVKLQQLGQYYVKQNRVTDPWRFDVIAVWWEDGQPQVKHYENAF
jgi:putative endonuclease